MNILLNVFGLVTQASVLGELRTEERSFGYPFLFIVLVVVLLVVFFNRKKNNNE